MGQAAIWGLLANGAYQLISAVFMMLFIGTIGVSLGALGLSYSTSSSDQMTVVILAIVGTVVPALFLILPVASAASAIATALGLHRGAKAVTLYAGALGAVLGPASFLMFAMFSLLIMGIIGLLFAAVGVTMMFVAIVVSALTVAVVSQQTALLREEARHL